MIFKRYRVFIFLVLVCTFSTKCTQKREYLECSINFLGDVTNASKGCLLDVSTQENKTVGKEDTKGLDQEIYMFLMNKKLPNNQDLSLPQVKIVFTKNEWANLNMKDNQFINPRCDKEPNPTIIPKSLMTVLLCFKEKKHFFARPIQHKILSVSKEVLPAYINGQHVLTNTTLMGCHCNNEYQPIPIPGTFLLKRISESNSFELRRLL